MLSRKQYVEIAKILAETRGRVLNTRVPPKDIVDYCIKDFTNYFKQDNPAFDVDKFNKTVYGE